MFANSVSVPLLLLVLVAYVILGGLVPDVVYVRKSCSWTRSGAFGGEMSFFIFCSSWLFVIGMPPVLKCVEGNINFDISFSEAINCAILSDG